MLLSALGYAEKGWRVIPVKRRAPGNKKPPYNRGGLTEATTDESVIRAWWEQWPDANVAVLLEDLFLVDIDMKPGVDGLASLARYESEHGKLITPCRQASGGGGRHFFFRMPDRPIKHSGDIPGYPGMEIWHGQHYCVVAP
ncbi:MAG: bifunctional DNA primase/polymerase, partial [Bryobacteraceae bacterium]